MPFAVPKPQNEMAEFKGTGTSGEWWFEGSNAAQQEQSEPGFVRCKK